MNLTTTERYQAFVEATKFQLLHELKQIEPPEHVVAAIARLDPAEITSKVINVMYGGTPPMMTTTPPTEPGWYWIEMGDEYIPCFICIDDDDGELCCEIQHSVISMTTEHLASEGARWSTDPITPPSDSALSLSEQYLHAVDAALQISETIAFKSPSTLCDGEATTEEKALAWRISMAIKGIDRAEIVRNVMSLLAESPDNPGAPVDMGDGDDRLPI